jgi:hypothetical protein
MKPSYNFIKLFYTNLIEYHESGLVSLEKIASVWLQRYKIGSTHLKISASSIRVTRLGEFSIVYFEQFFYITEVALILVNYFARLG